MNRKNCNDKDQIKYLDKVNNERLDNTRKRVAHAIRILKPIALLHCNADEQLKTDIAHAVNLLEVAVEEMKWHCEWFDYDDGVTFQLDDACNCLGNAMAEMFDDEHDVEMVTADVKDACIFLAKALATLVRWNDDSTDVSEI
ncbi:MAG: hypothetical protein MJ193_00785 [Clostridia bacterium]|nr:hypothetical protein [Clostridia bacterium]